MESNKSNADTTFCGTLNAANNSTAADVSRDESTAESRVGRIRSQIQELQEAYEKLRHGYCSLSPANAGSGERMEDGVNSSTQTVIPDGGILSLIQERQAAFQELGNRYHALFPANAASGQRMMDVVNSSSQTVIPEREEDDLLDLNTSTEALLELQKNINVGLRVRAFHLSIKLHKYESPMSTCLESKEHCCLCLDDYCDGEELAKIDCGHVYHVGCIEEWIKLKNSCPICKRDALAILI